MRVTTERLGCNGEGIAKCSEGVLKEKVCFVPFALPNEVVDVDILENKKKYCIGKVNKIISRSKNRVVPQCEYFTICGGCDLQHMDKSTQIDFKRNKIRDTLKKVGGINCDVEGTIRLNDWEYRNKMVFPITNGSNHAQLGMFASESHEVVEIDKCLISNKRINYVLSLTKEFLSNSSLKGYDFRNKSGDLKYLVVRSIADNILITIVATKNVDLQEYYDFISSKLDKFGISIVISDSDVEIMSGKYLHLFGLKEIEVCENDLKYSFDNRGFIQVNDLVKQELYRLIYKKININDIVIDAYSGAGLLSAMISKNCRRVVGIEINQSASNSAKNLVIENNLNNIEFICGDVKNNLSVILEKYKDVVLILDPPRSGCDKMVVDSICDLSDNIKSIIYISCNPSTLARDLCYLKEYFNINTVQPIDMFPQTKHVETLVELKRKKV